MDNGADSYRRFLDGDDSGFTEIVRDYKDALILYLVSFVGSIDTAEELAEDTFVKLGLKKPRFAGKSSFKTWLYAIGRNTAIDHIRKNAKHSPVSLEECEELAEADMELLENACIREERKIVLHRTMQKLKTEYRQVLWLLYFEGFSAKEAAKIMRKKAHGIETLAYRARKSLKAELLREGFRDEDL